MPILTNGKPTLLIFRDQLLGPSETFVMSQAEALKIFRPLYVCSRRVPGHTLPEDRVVALNLGGFRGRIKEITFKKWGLAPKFVREAGALNPVLLHAHFGPDGALCMPIARKLGIPLIVTLHGFEVTVSDLEMKGIGYSCRKFVLKRSQLISEARLFIAVSKFAKKAALSRGFPMDRVIVHYTGTDTEFFSPDPDVQREPVVLFVGRLVEKKGCEYAIRAMSEVQRELPEAKLVVIGDGPLRSSLEQHAASSLRNYEFLGVQNREVVRKWMNRARLLCGPSFIAQSGDAETFGMVFSEAQSMGLPVVAFDSGGIAEAVSNGKTGLLAAEKDWRALAGHIFALLRNQSAWDEFSRAGQDRVRHEFDLTRQCSLLEQIYCDAIAPRNLPFGSQTRQLLNGAGGTLTHATR